jgi:ribosomal protein S18 acetylase RimI-like enzyme
MRCTQAAGRRTNPALEIRAARVPRDIDAVRQLWKEYWGSLSLDPRFQGFEDELASLPGAYAEPGGLLLLAVLGADQVGTIALRRLSPQHCEAKRLYVRPEFRGLGIGRALLDRVVESARSFGYEKLFGDSLPAMLDAQNLYWSYGFRETGPYSAKPTPGAVYMELPLVNPDPPSPR